METLLRHEGGFVADPDDPGGATNHGVSLRWLRKAGLADGDGDGWPDGDRDRDGDIDAEDIRKLDRAAAIALYKAQWWDRHGYGGLPPRIGAKLFDLAVNMGAAQAHRLLQRALRANEILGLAEDGVLGPMTRRAVALAVDERGETPLLFALRSEAAGFYRALAAGDPKFTKWLKGWLRRAYS